MVMESSSPTLAIWFSPDTIAEPFCLLLDSTTFPADEPHGPDEGAEDAQDRGPAAD
jgi:hypothetical protein